jgi:hypothetical protein
MHQVVPGGVVRHFFDKLSGLFLDVGRCHSLIPPSHNPQITQIQDKNSTITLLLLSYHESVKSAESVDLFLAFQSSIIRKAVFKGRGGEHPQ